VNRYGGKWIVRLRKGLASRCWENLVLAMLGEQFMVGEEICGAVVSVRFQVRFYLLFKNCFNEGSFVIIFFRKLSFTDSRFNGVHVKTIYCQK